MLQLRRLAPALARNAGCLRELSTTPTLLQGPGKDKKDDKKEDEDGYELLPPGCSVVDPSYGLRCARTRGICGGHLSRCPRHPQQGLAY